MTLEREAYYLKQLSPEEIAVQVALGSYDLWVLKEEERA
jgi:hypothetical protein